MKCPNDNTTLQMTTREGIEIDYCPECRGVWLDRGELDKIIERSSAQTVRREDHSDERRYHEQPYQQRRDYDDDDYKHNNHHKKHKKEGFLGDLFDF
ncbi:MAG TPA: zf-TFIIB domain-containing protein [Candidatus Saccharimonadales bacterium]|nr:zf-TFIIB domain-containing protein [Candidatus Saccharimonadales bacterium]